MANKWIAWRQGYLGVWSLGHIEGPDGLTLCGIEPDGSAVKAGRAITKCSKCQAVSKSSGSTKTTASLIASPEDAPEDASKVELAERIEWIKEAGKNLIAYALAEETRRYWNEHSSVTLSEAEAHIRKNPPDVIKSLADALGLSLK